MDVTVKNGLICAKRPMDWDVIYTLALRRKAPAGGRRLFAWPEAGHIRIFCIFVEYTDKYELKIRFDERLF